MESSNRFNLVTNFTVGKKSIETFCKNGTLITLYDKRHEHLIILYIYYMYLFLDTYFYLL